MIFRKKYLENSNTFQAPCPQPVDLKVQLNPLMHNVPKWSDTLTGNEHELSVYPHLDDEVFTYLGVKN